MAITPSIRPEKEEEYFDKGAVTTPQINPVVDAKYAAAKAQALKNDYVEWPTDVKGLEY